MCSIVTLELEDELQVITEVVRTQAKAFRQVALVVATCYTANETNFCHVVEPNTVQRLVKSKDGTAGLHLQNAIALKRVSLLEHLQAIWLPLNEREFETAINTRSERCAATAQCITVEQEHDSGNGDSSAFVQHSSRQADRIGTLEIDIRSQRVLRR